MIQCAICKAEIPLERLECGFKTCINCSNTKKVRGAMIFSHKTAPEIIIVPENDSESIRRMERANKRSR